MMSDLNATRLFQLPHTRSGAKAILVPQFCCMHIEMFREYCLGLPAVTEEMPFGDNTLVYKVAGKMFALTGIDDFASINLKCEPEKALELREQYPAVQPGYHMNKQHWNTVLMDNSLPDQLVLQWTKDSYELVVAKLPSKTRNTLL